MTSSATCPSKTAAPPSSPSSETSAVRGPVRHPRRGQGDPAPADQGRRGNPRPAPELLDDPAAYGAALQAAATAIADGRDPEAAMAAIARQRPRELEA